MNVVLISQSLPFICYDNNTKKEDYLDSSYAVGRSSLWLHRQISFTIFLVKKFTINLFSVSNLKLPFCFCTYEDMILRMMNTPFYSKFNYSHDLFCLSFIWFFCLSLTWFLFSLCVDFVFSQILIVLTLRIRNHNAYAYVAQNFTLLN